jgi:hypothetical protein
MTTDFQRAARAGRTVVTGAFLSGNATTESNLRGHKTLTSRLRHLGAYLTLLDARYDRSYQIDFAELRIDLRRWKII